MKFFDRDNEIAKLLQIKELSKQYAQFTIITGRRRIGKTRLLIETFGGDNILYFFVSRKAEAELCMEFQEEISQKLGIPTLGQATRFADIFRLIMEISKSREITLVIDEFQEFYNVNRSIYSDIQKYWDLNKDSSKLNLIVCGSVYSMMGKIFQDNKEPLFGRQTAQMSVKPFGPSVLKEILREYRPDFTNDDLLALYTFTGGVAKYVENLVHSGSLSKDQIINHISEEDSIFITDGKNTLIEEFGRDYGTYFSILAAIASGHSTRAKIEEIIGREVGGYLTKLEGDYNLVSRHQPLFERTSATNMRYRLNDNFLIFWFRFVHKYGYMIETGSYEKLQDVIRHNYNTFSGLALEKYFRDTLAETGRYTRIGGWWNRKGDVEIDIIAADELSRTATFYEVKRQPQNYNQSLLESRRDAFLSATHQFQGFEIKCQGLSMEDM